MAHSLRPRTPPRIRGAVAEFLQTEAAGGAVLLAGAFAALAWANGPWRDSYADVWGQRLAIGIGGAVIREDLRHWVNEGLMTVFFFVVGLEIKRELVTGELRDRRAAALPVLAALGGMIVPALLYAAFTVGGPAARGWGIPMATDIAFAIGVLTLLGSRVPPTLRLFLLTLAIVDDIGAILVIALFYSRGLEPLWLLGAAVAAGVILALRRLGLGHPAVYVVPALALWGCTSASGIHATVAGVILGLLTPARPVHGSHVLRKLEHALHPVASFGIVPLFALANAGVAIGAGAVPDALGSPVGRGVLIGLVVGKPLGIAAAVALAVRLGWGRLPRGSTGRQVLGAGALAGIGFTVSLFVADLAVTGPRLGDAKLAVLLASPAAGLLGTLLLARATSVRRR